MIDRVQITARASGSAGSASGSAYSPHIAGEVLKVALSYAGSPPATTDVTLEAEEDPQAEAIVSIADAATDLALYPRRVLEQNDGTDLTDYGPYVVHGRLKLTIAQANDQDAVTAIVWLRI